MRAAVIGIGRIGWKYSISGEQVSHVSSYLKCPRTELVAVADIDDRRLEAFKREYPNIPCYTDYEVLMNREKPEIVSVCTPTETHARIVRNIVRYEPVKVVFCEKPISNTPIGAEKMIRTCENFGVKLAVNHSRRWDPAYRRIKRIVDGRDETWRVGELLMFDGRFSGDPVGDGVHMTDLYNWMKQENTKLSLLNIPIPYSVIFEADLWGSNGLIRVLDNGYDIQLWFLGESRRWSGPQGPLMELGGIVHLEETYDFSQAMLNVVDDLVECAQSDKQPECTGIDGLNALKLALEKQGG